jgi:hypothetical protein
MGAMEFRPGSHFALVGRFDTLPVVPPSPGTKQIRADLRSTDGAHSTFILSDFWQQRGGLRRFKGVLACSSRIQRKKYLYAVTTMGKARRVKPDTIFLVNRNGIIFYALILAIHQLDVRWCPLKADIPNK